MKYQFKNSLQHRLYISLALTMTLGSTPLLATEVCDIDGNNTITQNDIDLIFQAKNTQATIPFDPMDIDRSGVIDTNDARLCVCKLPSTDACSVPFNQAPVAHAGSDQNLRHVFFSEINLDGRLSSDPDNDFLSYQWNFQQKPAGSQVALSDANTVTPRFIPDRFGTYVLSLIVSDGFGEKSNADSITLTISNPSPLEARADSHTMQAGGTPISGNLLSNDVVINRTINLAPLLTNVITPNGGVFSLQNNGRYTYTPPQLIDVAIEETLNYTITGRDGKQSSSTLTINVSPNEPLQAIADNTVAQAGRNSVTGNVLSNDIFGDRTLNLSPILTNVATPKGGVFSLQNNGRYTYTPPQLIDIAIEETLNYTIIGRDGKKSTSTLTITTSPNLPLQAQSDTNTVQAGGVTATGNVLDNDLFNNRTITLSPLLSNFLTPKGGVFSLENNGQYVYIPPQSVDEITAENMTYTITGLDGKQSNATLSITINPPAPLEALADNSSVQAGGSAIAGNVLGNDIFDNRTINISPLLTNFSTPRGGVFSLQNDGNYTYLPPQEINEKIEESIIYTITGGDGKQSSATLVVVVNPNNRLPLARPDSNNVAANGSAISGNVLINDDRGNQPTQIKSPLTNVQTPLGGIFSLQIDGSYSYMPPKNSERVLQEQFNYTIADIDGDVSTSTLTIVVSPENRQPVAQSDSASVTAGGLSITGNVLENDDLGNQPTTLLGTISDFQTPLGGMFSLASSGVYTYTPPQQMAGVATEKFDYTITDIDGEVSNAALTIRVSPENFIPLANPDNSNATANGDVVTGNVLINDTQGNAPATVTLIPSTNLGSLDLSADGSYRYTPPSRVSGVVNDIFTYTLTDQDGDISTSTLTIRVSVQNLTPLANPDQNNATENGDVVTGNVLINDTQGNAPASVTLVPSTNLGSLDLSADGNYRYTPPSSVSGVVNDIFTYTLTDQDGETSTSTLTIQVGIQNFTPLANPDNSNATANGEVVTGNVLINDTQGNAPATVTLIPSTNLGSLDLQADGSYRYTPPSRVSGVVNDIFTYTLTDQDGETSTSTLTIQVGIQNFTPLANPDNSNATANGEVVTGNVLINDTQGNAPATVTLIPSTNLGSLDLQADGSYRYTPPSRVSGVVNDIFTYTLTDQDGETSTSTLTIQVGIQNFTPLANPDNSNATANGEVVTGNVLINDTQGNAPATVTLIPSTNLGSLDLQADGSYRYTPPSRVSGVVNDIFTYTLTDQDGETSTSTLTIQVGIQNFTPLANPDNSNATANGEVVTGNVLINDTQGNAPATVTLIPSTNLGSLDLQADGSYRYTPPSRVSGVVNDIFTYTLTDQDGETSTSTLTIQVGIQNFTPLANPDNSNATANGEVVTGNVLINDTQGNAPATVTLIPSTNLGSLDLQADGSYRYTPPSRVSGVVNDIFTYTLTDQDGDISTSMLTIRVSVQNLTPLANPDVLNIKANESTDGVFGNVLENDVLGDAPTTVVLINASTESGSSLNLQANGDYEYFPSSTINLITTRLTESFEYTMSDNDGETSTSILTIKIDPSCHAVDDVNEVTASTEGAFNRVSGNVVTNDVACASPVSVTPLLVTATKLGGSFELLSNGRYTYSAPFSFVTSEQQESFIYTLTDNNGDTSSATLVITIKPDFVTPIDNDPNLNPNLIDF